MSFIDGYLEHTKFYESPGSFWRWSAYGAIAAVLRDNCYLKQGDEDLFANMYILLLATSAVQRKGRPVKLCEKLVTKIGNTKIISGKASVQGIYDAMAINETDPKTGKINKGGSSILFAEELSAALVSDPQQVASLTNMYDYKDNFREQLRVKGRQDIGRMVFSIVAGSNEDLLKDVYTKQAVQGGLLGRTFLIVPNEFRDSDSLFDLPDMSKSLACLVKQLQEISELKGGFIIDDEAKAEYNKWYKPFRLSYKDQGDRSGIIGRLHTGVLKLSFIFAANDLSLTIRAAHIDRAITECIALIPNYNTFIFASGKSTIAEAGGILIQDLMAANHEQHCLSRKAILRNHWKDFDDEILTKVVTTLELGGHIRTIVFQNEMHFQLTEHCIKMMKGEK